MLYENENSEQPLLSPFALYLAPVKGGGCTSGFKERPQVLIELLLIPCRPLVFYGFMEFLAVLQYVALTAAGFKLQHLQGVDYYTYNLKTHQSKQSPAGQHSTARTTAAADSRLSSGVSELHSHHHHQQTGDSTASSSDAAFTDNAPIVFLHGVGAGLLPYLALVFSIASLGRPMILPESKHVSMRLMTWLPTVDDMADTTAAILQAHGVQRAVVMGHSYGTFVASRLVLKYGCLVHSLCLMDPVSKQDHQQ